MSIREFVETVANFDILAPREQICLLAWYLHTKEGADLFGNAEIRECFRKIGASDPGVSVYLPRMADRKPPDVIRRSNRYYLERRIRAGLDKKYGEHPTTVAVASLLSDLPAKVPNSNERSFLQEAIDCYRVKAFRSAIVMTWNLTFDHLLRWILSDASRVGDFNAAVVKRFPKKTITVSKFDHFEEFKESEIVEICNTAGLFSSNITKILRQKLDRRNIAAHPSDVIITQPQVDDMISDLVNNVVLQLK